MEPWGFEPQISPCHGDVIPFHYGPETKRPNVLYVRGVSRLAVAVQGHFLAVNRDLKLPGQFFYKVRKKGCLLFVADLSIPITIDRLQLQQRGALGEQQAIAEV